MENSDNKITLETGTNIIREENVETKINLPNNPSQNVNLRNNFATQNHLGENNQDSQPSLLLNKTIGTWNNGDVECFLNSVYDDDDNDKLSINKLIGLFSLNNSFDPKGYQFSIEGGLVKITKRTKGPTSEVATSNINLPISNDLGILTLESWLNDQIKNNKESQKPEDNRSLIQFIKDFLQSPSTALEGKSTKAKVGIWALMILGGAVASAAAVATSPVTGLGYGLYKLGAKAHGAYKDRNKTEELLTEQFLETNNLDLSSSDFSSFDLYKNGSKTNNIQNNKEKTKSFLNPYLKLPKENHAKSVVSKSNTNEPIKKIITFNDKISTYPHYITVLDPKNSKNALLLKVSRSDNTSNNLQLNPSNNFQLNPIAIYDPLNKEQFEYINESNRDSLLTFENTTVNLNSKQGVFQFSLSNLSSQKSAQSKKLLSPKDLKNLLENKIFTSKTEGAKKAKELFKSLSDEQKESLKKLLDGIPSLHGIPSASEASKKFGFTVSEARLKEITKELAPRLNKITEQLGNPQENHIVEKTMAPSNSYPLSQDSLNKINKERLNHYRLNNFAEDASKISELSEDQEDVLETHNRRRRENFSNTESKPCNYFSDYEEKEINEERPNLQNFAIDYNSLNINKKQPNLYSVKNFVENVSKISELSEDQENVLETHNRRRRENFSNTESRRRNSSLNHEGKRMNKENFAEPSKHQENPPKILRTGTNSNRFHSRNLSEAQNYKRE